MLGCLRYLIGPLAMGDSLMIKWSTQHMLDMRCGCCVMTFDDKQSPAR